jgi:hypothetical protein
MNRIIGIFALFFVVCFLTGCSKNYPDGMPKLHPVQITVVGDGQPIANAGVTLMPMDQENSRWASGGQTGSNGVAILKTQGVYSGAATGKYKVCISKAETDPTPPVGPDETPPPTNSYNLIDPKFGNMETTTEVEVVAGNNSWQIDVGKPIRELIQDEKR